MPETPVIQENQSAATGQTGQNDQKAPTAQPVPVNLKDLSIEAVLAKEEDIDPRVAIHGDFPHHKYEKILIKGFTTKLTTEEIVTHPLIVLLHDYKHLMLHGNRGSKNDRDKKRKSKKPYENRFCRLSFIYTIAQDPVTCDLVLRFIIDTAFEPVWTRHDGSLDHKMTLDDIASTTAFFVESYLAEAKQLLKSTTASCSIDSTTVIQIIEEGESSKTATPPRIRTNLIAFCDFSVILSIVSARPAERLSTFLPANAHS